MFGKGRNQRNKLQQRRMNQSQSGVCVCPQCNYSTAHKRGVPCTTLRCPNCNVPLTRQVSTENTSQQFVSNKNSKSSDFPSINTELCVGCGACVRVCPADAIHLENGKAVISIEKCRKCRACVTACPVGAIK